MAYKRKKTASKPVPKYIWSILSKSAKSSVRKAISKRKRKVRKKRY